MDQSTNEPTAPRPRGRGRKSVVAAGLAIGLVAGGSAGVVLGSPLLVSAQDSGQSPSSSESTASTASTTTTVVDAQPADDPTPATDDTTNTADPSTTSGAGEVPTPETSTPQDAGTPRADVPSAPGRRSERVQAALKGLVENGTITQSQADAVIKAIRDLAASEKTGNGPRGGWTHRSTFDFGDVTRSIEPMRKAYEALGLTPGELARKIKDGKSLAEIARERGVDPQTLVDAAIAPMKERLDKAVAEGRLSREKADERLAQITAATQDFVNNGALPRGLGSKGTNQGDRGTHPSGPNGSGTAEPGD